MFRYSDIYFLSKVSYANYTWFRGAVGAPLALELKSYTEKIRLVSRTPQQVNADELFTANLTSAKAVMDAVKGSEVAYLTAGKKYDINVWQRDWPIIRSHEGIRITCIAAM